ncbi:uncharacterized protein LOC131230635 [Magnolia sinica]|uniref:uncharacterized protein LOC131230635 n=1 Tax=Magnolia sinica TaxID=86752 RepID=UPI00265974C9|nr:uncharacterized protein LOC131230635 [Magnolia sinica]
MASETALIDSITVDHVEEKKANEIKENAQEERVSQSDEKGKPKVEESPIVEAVVTEAKEKTEDPKIEEPPIAEAVVTEPEEKADDPKVKESPIAIAVVTETEEKAKDLKVEESPTAEAAATEPEEKAKDYKQDTPAVEAVEKVEQSDRDPVSVGSVDGCLKAIESSEQIPVPSAVPETTVEVCEKGLEELPKIPDAAEASTEAVVEKPVENSEVCPSQEPELEAGKEVPEPAIKVVEKAEESLDISNVAESAPEEQLAKEKPLEQSAVAVAEKSASEAIKEVEKKIETPAAKESVEGEIPEDEKASADKVEAETEPLKEEPSAKEDVSLAAVLDKIEDGTSKVQEDVAPQSSDTVVSADREVPISQACAETAEDDKLKEAVEAKVNESVEDTKKEESSVGVIEGLVKEAAVEAGLPDPSTAIGVVKALETTSITEIAENLVKLEGNAEEEKEVESVTTKTVDVGGSDAVAEITKSSFEGETASKDVEIVAEEKKEEIGKEDIPSSIDAPKNPVVDENIGISKEKGLVAKVEEAVQTVIDKVANVEEKNEEAEKSDVQKDSSDSKKEADATKQEVSVKTVHRQSNNIISKVKQSIVKVKKAIIGKSPSSKTLSSEAKDDIKVK